MRQQVRSRAAGERNRGRAEGFPRTVISQKGGVCVGWGIWDEIPMV